MLRIVSYILFLITGILSLVYLFSLFSFDIHFWILSLFSDLEKTTQEEKLWDNYWEDFIEEKKVLPDFLQDFWIKAEEVKREDIFGIYIFSFPFTAFRSFENNMDIWIFDSYISYNSVRDHFTFFLKEMYEINETNSFFDRSFYVNPSSWIGEKVRIIFSYKEQIIAMEIFKKDFLKIKNLLLK